MPLINTASQRILAAMKSRIQVSSQLKSINTYIEASYFNRVRLALLRLESPLRIQLASMRGLDIILDHHEWVCVDRAINDLPTMAWTDFDTGNRGGIHQPVSCQLRFFHNHADLICGSVLQLVERNLQDRLARIKPVQQQPSVVYLGSHSHFQ